MFKGLFNPDNAVLRAITRFGYIWWLNILWLVCSLPIITIGASTTALIYSCMKLRKDEGYPTRNFFHSFKENFGQSTLIWLLYLVVGLCIAWGFIFWNHSTLFFAKVAWAVVLAVAIAYGISFMFVFAIQSKFYNSIKDTIRFSFLVPIHNLKETILIAMIVGAVIILNVCTTFIVNFFTMNLGIGALAYYLGMHYETIFKQYVPETEEPDPDEWHLEEKEV